MSRAGGVKIPEVEPGLAIPKIIHQIYAYPTAMPAHLAAVVDDTRRANPTWEHRLYDMAAMESFISRHYGPDVLDRFHRIKPEYGVARADLFRYLAIYRHGGVYLDIKSKFTRPIDEVVKGDEGFVISHWDNGPADAHANWGLHEALAHLPRGEIQQWHVIAVAGHPYLKRTIVNLLQRIECYRPWRNHAGWLGVLHLTGPVAYTLDIQPILDQHPHAVVRDQRDLGLQYSIFASDDHKKLSPVHYVNLESPVVQPPGLAGLAANAYWRARQWKRRMTGSGAAAH